MPQQARKAYGQPEIGSSEKSFRAYALGADKDAGAWGRDEIRNIYGEIWPYSSMGGSVSGVFSSVSGNNTASRGNGRGTAFVFDASRSVPTGSQNVPQHIWQPAILYLGRPA